MATNVCPTVQIPLNSAIALRKDLRMVPQELGGGRCYVVEDPLRSKFYRIGLREFALISLFDGRTTLAEALGLAATTLGPDAFDEQEVLAIARWLVECQLIAKDGAGAEPKSAKPRPAGLLHSLVRDPLFIQLPLFNPDGAVERAMPYCGWLLGTKFLAVWIATVCLAVHAAASSWGPLVSASRGILDTGNWARMTAAWICLSVIHEFFHALACKRFGGTVPRAGLALLLFAPAAFVDVTASWRFTSRRARMITAAAGIYAELFVAGVALLVWSATGDGVLRRFSYDLALMASVSTLLFNANPLMRFDGYYLFSDLVQIPNLSSRGRHWVRYLFERHLLGFDVACPSVPDRHPAVFRVYALAAMLWRGLLTVTIGLAAIGMFSYLGVIVVGLLVALRVLPAASKTLMRVLRHEVTLRRSSRQSIAAGGIAVALVIGIAAWLHAPGTIRARAVIEYAPLTVVRTGSAGFVAEVFVRDGDPVREGQLLARLTNDELRAKLADLALAAEQSRIQARIYHQEKDLPKYQVEMFQSQSLEKKKTELEKQVADLDIRAAASGRIVGRGLDSLVGRYFEAGDELAVIGSEESKELRIAVAQDDVQPFQSQLGKPVAVRVWGGPLTYVHSLLDDVEPRALLDCPHPALSAQGGGPLAVKPAATDTSDAKAAKCELLNPVFYASAALSVADSERFRAGQLATVSFPCGLESRWSLLKRSASHWIREKMQAGDNQ